MPIFSLQIEKHVLGGLIKNPDVLAEVDAFISEKDFSNDTHGIIYSIIRQALCANEKLDKVILAQKIKNHGISFKDDINIFDYIDSICFTEINRAGTVEACQELKKLSIRRDLHEMGTKIQQAMKTGKDLTIDQIISSADEIYSEKIHSFHITQGPKNIFDGIEEDIEEIGNNPPDPNSFLMGPFKHINDMYGSLLRQGAINLVGARTGVGKTAFSMFYLLYVAEKYNLPILHLDFSEMTLDELRMRAVCMFTKGEVPYHAIESGEWRKNPLWTKLVRAVWPRVKKIKMYYEDIGSMTPYEIITLIRKFSYKTAGRGNRFLVNYDYLKPFNFDPRTPEYKEMGHFIQMLKSLITNEIPASAWASLQLNRMGITNNKVSKDIDDSENSFSLSDRIIQQCTHAWLARPKLIDEIAEVGLEWGNMKLECMKHRHLGKDFSRALTPVKTETGKFRKNYINIHGSSFYFEERGDLNDLVKAIKLKYKPEKENENDRDGELM